jgi:hypothetical protein
VAKENFSLEMLMSTSVGAYPLALNASPVRQEFVLGFLSTALHTAVRCRPVDHRPHSLRQSQTLCQIPTKIK